MMQQLPEQINVKEFLTREYDGKLEESELLESSRAIYDFFSILSDTAKEQNIENDRHGGTNVGAESI